MGEGNAEMEREYQLEFTGRARLNIRVEAKNPDEAMGYAKALIARGVPIRDWFLDGAAELDCIVDCSDDKPVYLRSVEGRLA